MRRELRLALLAVLWGCDGDGAESPSASSVSSPSDPPLITKEQPTDEQGEDIDALMALGYLDYAEGDGSEPAGLLLHVSGLAQSGLTLVASRPNRRADLVALDGSTVHSWKSRDEVGRWVRARLLEGGDILVVGKGAEGPGEARYLQRIDASGEEVWRRAMAIHHEIATGPDGGWLTLELNYRSIPEIHPTVPVRDDQILFLDSEGRPLRRLSLYDSLSSAGVELTSVEPYVGDSGMMVDLFHSNSLFWMDGILENVSAEWRRDPIYAEGGVLICIRHQNRVAILDSKTGELRWTWGPGEISGPHDATLLKSGNVLIFDNGLGSGQSRVVEVDPRTDTIVWQYQAPQPTDFYSASRGSAQRLENGNTLIAESDEGHAFEVTSAGQVVWSWRSPHSSTKESRATIIRAIRYPESWRP
jgi:hypothetical protein